MSRPYWTRAMAPGHDERSQSALPSPRARLELVRHYSMGMPAEQPQPAEAATDLGIDDDADPQLSAAVWRLYGAAVLVALSSFVAWLMPIA